MTNQRDYSNDPHAAFSYWIHEMEAAADRDLKERKKKEQAMGFKTDKYTGVKIAVRRYSKTIGDYRFVQGYIIHRTDTTIDGFFLYSKSSWKKANQF